MNTKKIIRTSAGKRRTLSGLASNSHDNLLSDTGKL